MPLYSDSPKGTLARPPSRTTLIVIGLAVVLGVIYRFATLSKDALNCDELYSWAVTKLSFGAIARENFDVHPPVFYLALKAVTAFGQSEFALRLISALCGLGVVAIVYFFARSRVGFRGAAVGALCLLFSFKHIVYSSLARNYSLELLLCIAASWALINLAEDLFTEPRRARGAAQWGVLYGLLAAVSLLTHSMAAVYLLIFNGILFIAYSASSPRKALRLAAMQALANAPGFALFTLWYLSAQQNGSDFTWLGRFTPAQAAEKFIAVFAPTGLPLPITLLVALIILVGVALSFRSAPRAYLVLEIALIGALPLALYVISLVKPVYMERTIIFAAPGASLAIGALIASIRSQRAALGLGAVLVLAFAASATTYVFRGTTRPAYGMEPIQDFRRAFALADADLKGASAIMTCEGFTEPAFRYYGAKAHATHVMLEPPHPLGDLVGDWRRFYAIPTPKRIYPDWVRADPNALAPFSRVVFVDVTNFCGPQGGTTERALAGAGFTETSRARVQGIDVRVFDKAAVAAPKAPPVLRRHGRHGHVEA